MLAVIDDIEGWCHSLKGTQYIITIYTNSNNLEYFMSACILSYYQEQWSMSLSSLIQFCDYVLSKESLKKVGSLSFHSYFVSKMKELVLN
jgi:hypothetical protein